MEALEIFCDEAGHTGPRLLDPNQRFFAYASVALTDEEAFRILREAREAHPVQMPELKASKLLKYENGRKLIRFVLEAVEGRYQVVAIDKLLGLCAKVFEYIYEPVFQDDPRLLYCKNLHRFVAMYCYTFFVEQDEHGEEAVRQFERFMRSLDPAGAPLLFGTTPSAASPDDNPFLIVLRFAQGFRNIIIADNQGGRDYLADKGKWTLDLAISALWSLLNHWGGRGKPLRVVCDESKPLEAQIQTITGGEDDPGLQRAAKLFPESGMSGWTLGQPIEFADSRDHPALQVADLIAGTTVRVLTDAYPRENKAPDEQLRELARLLLSHIHPHSMLPDFDFVNPTNREAAVNWFILFGLGERATKGEDPHALLPEMYAIAETLWDEGDFPTFGSKAG